MFKELDFKLFLIIIFSIFVVAKIVDADQKNKAQHTCIRSCTGTVVYNANAGTCVCN